MIPPADDIAITPELRKLTSDWISAGVNSSRPFEICISRLELIKTRSVALERLERMIEPGFKEGTMMRLKNLEELLQSPQESV
ncbi:MAG TPA: hypothetical protein VE961_25530 [Pyrinomonadaceae bacterium]|nr:hypothetical protein [Pyrinomonadaceae bacterium]